MAKAKASLGDDVRLSEARRKRSGGLAGFFAKETFHVTVERPAAAPPAAKRPAPSAPPSTRRPAAPPEEAPPSSLLELADLVDEAEATAAAATAAVRRTVAPPPRPTAPAPVLSPTLRAPEHLPSTEGATFQEVMRRLVDQNGLPARMPAPAPPAAAAAPTPTVPNLTVTTRSAPAVPARPTRPVLDRALAPGLLALGVPSSMLPAEASPGAVVAALMRSLDLPAAPAVPRGDRSVVVVLGDRRAAKRVADRLAGSFHDELATVRVAAPGFHGPQHLGEPADVAAERRSWSSPTVVALGSPVEQRDLGWATAMLDALSADVVWGVVGADRKCEDVQAWADGLGGIDALALEHLDATVSPASMLQLGIPVGYLDGRPASATMWAVMLAERLVA